MNVDNTSSTKVKRAKSKNQTHTESDADNNKSESIRTSAGAGAGDIITHDLIPKQFSKVLSDIDKFIDTRKDAERQGQDATVTQHQTNNGKKNENDQHPDNQATSVMTSKKQESPNKFDNNSGASQLSSVSSMVPFLNNHGTYTYRKIEALELKNKMQEKKILRLLEENNSVREEIAQLRKEKDREEELYKESLEKLDRTFETKVKEKFESMWKEKNIESSFGNRLDEMSSKIKNEAIQSIEKQITDLLMNKKKLMMDTRHEDTEQINKAQKVQEISAESEEAQKKLETEVGEGRGETILTVAKSPEAKESNQSSSTSIKSFSSLKMKPLSKSDKIHDNVISDLLVCNLLDDNNGKNPGQRKNIIVSSSLDTTIKLSSMSDRKVIATLTGHTSMVTALALIRMDGDLDLLVSSSCDKTLKLWDLHDHSLIASRSCQVEICSLTAYEYRGKYVIAIGLDNGKINLLDANLSRNISTSLKAHKKSVRALKMFEYSRDNKGEESKLHLVSGSMDTNVKIWSIHTDQDKDDKLGESSKRKKKNELIATLSECKNPAASICVFEYKNDTIIAVAEGFSQETSSQCCIRLWKMSDFSLVHIFTGIKDDIYAIKAFVPTATPSTNPNADNKEEDTVIIVSCGFDKFIRLWNVRSKELDHTVKSKCSMWSLEVCQDNEDLTIVAGDVHGNIVKISNHSNTKRNNNDCSSSTKKKRKK